MIKQASLRYLGEEVFCVTESGDIIRTAIERIGLGGTYWLMNHRITRSHFFTLEEASIAAVCVLKSALESGRLTRTEEQSASETIKSIQSDEFQGSVIAQPLILGAKLSGFIPEKILGADEAFPTGYFEPGQEVFGIVTPRTHYGISPGWSARRPYFILATSVTEVTYSPRWREKTFYTLKDTHFSINNSHLYATEALAREKLVSIFAEETGGTIEAENIQVVAVSDEKEAYDALLKKLSHV